MHGSMNVKKIIGMCFKNPVKTRTNGFKKESNILQSLLPKNSVESSIRISYTDNLNLLHTNFIVFFCDYSSYFFFLTSFFLYFCNFFQIISLHYEWLLSLTKLL
jgi:hypothetical protein